MKTDKSVIDFLSYVLRRVSSRRHLSSMNSLYFSTLTAVELVLLLSLYAYVQLDVNERKVAMRNGQRNTQNELNEMF